MKTTFDKETEKQQKSKIETEEELAQGLMKRFKCDMKRARELCTLGFNQGYLMDGNKRIIFNRKTCYEVKEASIEYIRTLKKESSWCELFTQDLIDLKKPHQTVFIETGTASGFSAKAALQAGFSTVNTIELNHYFCEYAAKFLMEDPTHPDWRDKVTIRCGSSVEVLPVVFKENTEPFVLWLDAHWSGGPHLGENMGAYLPKELAAIAMCNVDFTDCSILIDDMNHFINEKPFLDLIAILLTTIKPNGTPALYDSPSGHIFMTSL